MRLLAGVPGKQDAAASADQDRDWIGLTAGTALEEALDKLRRPESLASADPPGLARRASALSANRRELAAACHRVGPGGLPGR